MGKVKFSDPFADGRSYIWSGDIVYCNTKYNKPWAMLVTRLDGSKFDGEWLERRYDGYGKHSEVYYDLTSVVPGDVVRVSGGSGKNYYPQCIEVLSTDGGVLAYKTLTDTEARHRVKAKAEPPEPRFTITLSQLLKLVGGTPDAENPQLFSVNRSCQSHDLYDVLMDLGFEMVGADGPDIQFRLI